MKIFRYDFNPTLPPLAKGRRGGVSGQGLLEAVIALGIIITGVVAALTLAIGSLSAAGASESRLIAANFAREGIELVRNQRDSNWVGARSWDKGIEAVGEANAYAPEWNATTQQMELVPLSNTTTQGRLYYVPETGMYSPIEMGQATRFFRSIILTNIICEDGTAGCAVGDRIGVRVQSNVSWENRGVLP
ncbi:MAG: hypothetical protein Q7S16_05415, partial [bacterium]|nr:hypothetical protein [bacterium]